MRRKRHENSKKEVSKFKNSEDPKFNLVPVVIVERCSFNDFLETNLSERNPEKNSKIRGVKFLQPLQDSDPRSLLKSLNKSKKNMAHLEDPKFNLVPVVIVERCNFNDFLETNLSEQNAEQNSKIKGVKYSQLLQDLGPRSLSKPVNKSKKNIALNANGENPKNIPVHSKHFVALNKEDHVIQNDEIYQTKRKMDNIHSNTQSVYSKAQQSKLNYKKTTLKCLNNKKKSDNFISKTQSNEKKVLRERRVVNYKEKLSIGTPEVNQNFIHPNGTRIPIYQQVNSIQTFSNERKHDQYDFIPESDEDKGSDFSFHIQTPAKKRKVIKTLQFHKKRANAINTKQNNLMKSKKVDKFVKYEDKVEMIMNNIKHKINRNNKNIKASKQILTNENTQADQKAKTNLNKNNTNNPTITMEIIFNSTQKPESLNISLPNESLIVHNEDKATDNNSVNGLMKQDMNSKFMKGSNHNRQNISLHKESPIFCNKKNQNKCDTSINERTPSERNDELSDSNNCAAKSRSILYCPSSPASNFADDVSEDSRDDSFQCHTSEYPAHISNEEKDVNGFFGFDEYIEEENQKEMNRTGRINIVENLLLRKSSIPSPSTPLKKRPLRSSWRFNADCKTRNPHFLNVKSDGLPSLNQDPVLDHTFDDRLREFNTSISVPQAGKSPKQKSILDYVESDKEHFVDNHTRPSLYNIDEYSPIKINPADKENFNVNRTQGIKRSTRRNVLGRINENTMTGKTSTPAKSKNPSVPIRIDLSLIESEKQPEVSISKHFGFDSCSEIVENEIIGADKENVAKPFRLQMNFERRKKPEQLLDKLDKPVRDSEVRRLVGNDSEFLKLIEDDGLESEKFGLFEDAEISQNVTKCYKPRTKRKFAATQDNPKKKDKECKLSKEAKKWIKEFNQMCDEIEETKLEFD